MLVYPDAVPQSDRDLIDDAVRQEDEAFRDTYTPPHMFVVGPGTRPLPSPDHDRSDAAAVDGLLRVIDAIIRTLAPTATRRQWPAGQLVAIVDELAEQRQTWVYLHQHSRRILIDAFRNDVSARLHSLPAWHAVHQAPPAAPTPPPVPADDDRPLLTMAQAAKRLSCSDDTIRHMGQTGTLTLVPVGRGWRVRPDDIDRLLQSDQYRYRR